MIGQTRLAIAGLLAIAALAGCGSGTPSSSSPATLAPANSLLYLELTVRPQGTQHAAVESALTRLLGHSPNAGIERAVNRLLRPSGPRYASDIQPWLGQRIGFVVTGLAPAGIGLIAPTNDPSDALRTLERMEHSAHLRPASYAGVRYQTGQDVRQVALGIVGHNAVIASPSVFTSIVDAYHGRSLTHSSAFTSAMAALPSGSLIRGYVAASHLRSSLSGVFASLPSARLPSSLRPLVENALSRLRGTFSFSLSAASRAFSLDLHSSRPTHGPAGDVSSLPGQSWLAAASASLNPARLASILRLALRRPAGARALAHLRRRYGINVMGDVVPALGPFAISMQGTSPLSLGGGLLISSHSRVAAGRLLAALHRLAARDPSLAVQGSSLDFTITKRGLPIPRVTVIQSGQRTLVTLDEVPSALLSPATTLASSPRFSTVRSQLPAGSRVSLFLDFRTMTALLQSLPTFTENPRNLEALRTLERLDYLVVGSDPATGQSRLVLALR